MSCSCYVAHEAIGGCSGSARAMSKLVENEGTESNSSRKVEITAPILDYQPGMSAPPSSVSVIQSQEPLVEEKERSWNANPIYTTDDDEDDDYADEQSRMKPLVLSTGNHSDTLSSDMIVNSISNGQWQLMVW